MCEVTSIRNVLCSMSVVMQCPISSRHWAITRYAYISVIYLIATKTVDCQAIHFDGSWDNIM